jgi:hypothetical protein
MSTEDQKLRNLYEIRRKNLKAELEKRGWGAKKKLSEALGYSNATHISHLLRPEAATVVKWQIPEKLARRIEKTSGMPWGWLDVDHGSDRPVKIGQAATEPDPRRLEHVLATVGTVAGRMHVKQTPAEMAKLVSIVYAYAPPAGDVSETLVKQILQMGRKA